MNLIKRCEFYWFVALGLLLVSVVFWPTIDLTVSEIFYRPDGGFFLANQPILVALHIFASKGSWLLGFVLLVLALVSAFRKNTFATLSSKEWLFLFLALLIGPGLIANKGFKDHWGRARPNQTVAFGGEAKFSNSLSPQHVKRSNGSFVAGDAAFGFFLPSLAYVFPSPRSRSRIQRRSLSRAIFWAGLAMGSGFGLMRIAMGAHFLSDVAFAAFFMLLSSAGIHAALYGLKETRADWALWLGIKAKTD